MGFVLTFLIAVIERQHAIVEANNRFSFAADDVALRVQERMDAFALMLRGAAGLFNAQSTVTRDEWAAYVDNLRLNENLSTVHGVGFSQLIPREQLKNHIDSMVNEGFEDYAVTPSGERDIYTSIVFLEPAEDRNLRALGFDMFSEPMQRAAMENARDLNEASMTGRVQLVQETGTDEQAGILIYVPIYLQNVMLQTVEQRRHALRGWAYSPFRMADLMEGLLGNWSRIDLSSIGQRLYDVDESGKSLLYITAGLSELPSKGRFTHQIQQNIHGRTWQFEFEALADSGLSGSRTTWFLLVFGAAVTLLLVALMISLAHTRNRALAIAGRLTHDISERELDLRTASAKAEHFREALEHVNSLIYIKDTKRLYQYANKVCLELFGCTAESLKNSTDQRFFPPEVCEQLERVDERVLRGEKTESELQIIGADGTRHFFLDVKTPIYDDQDRTRITGILGIASDITAIKLHEQNMERIAHYDALTGLPNRLLLADRLSQATAHARRDGCQIALVFLDLDEFKAINDQFGHSVGDELLQVVAIRLKESVRDGDTVARIGGDEFVAVLRDTHGRDNINIILRRMMKAASDPIFLHGETLKVSASIGVSLYPQESDISEDQLMRQADQAMYHAKNAGRHRAHLFVADAEPDVLLVQEL